VSLTPRVFSPSFVHFLFLRLDRLLVCLHVPDSEFSAEQHCYGCRFLVRSVALYSLPRSPAPFSSRVTDASNLSFSCFKVMPGLRQCSPPFFCLPWLFPVASLGTFFAFLFYRFYDELVSQSIALRSAPAFVASRFCFLVCKPGIVLDDIPPNDRSCRSAAVRSGALADSLRAISRVFFLGEPGEEFSRFEACRLSMASLPES